MSKKTATPPKMEEDEDLAKKNPSFKGRGRSGSMASISSGGKRLKMSYVSITSHPNVLCDPLPVNWGASDPATRGPIVATANSIKRNAIGAHGGSYSIYLALAVASGVLDENYQPDYTNTQPAVKLGPHPQWFDPEKIVTIDPYGALVPSVFEKELKSGIDARPTIAITKAHIDFPEVKEALRVGRLVPDGEILREDGQVNVSKAAIEPVWYLPGVAKRFGVSEQKLRHILFSNTNGMYPELLTRNDLQIFLPPIGGITVYIFGDLNATLKDPKRQLCVRVHDECNGSDVFGSDICTCRPYLAHAIEMGIETAQGKRNEDGSNTKGCGVVIYFRKEGRALGEVTKYLVYNARKRAEGGDKAAEYFNCTKNVAGIEDSRFQALMPDVLHWLGIKTIDLFVSMSNMKYDAITKSGIVIKKRVPIPKELVPKDAQVEITAKVFAGYEGGDTYKVTADDLQTTKGRGADEFGVNAEDAGGDQAESSSSKKPAAKKGRKKK